MLTRYSGTILCDGSGNAAIYLGKTVTGKIISIRYTPGTIATGATLTITGETTGMPILTKANAGTAAVSYYPRAIPNKNTDGSAFTDVSDPIYVFEERIKVAVASGGAAGLGSILVLVDEVK